jgi:hypothetical protein
MTQAHPMRHDPGVEVLAQIEGLTDDGFPNATFSAAMA